MSNWFHLLSTAMIMAFGWAVVRVLDPLVTRVRARHGLAMAWGTAILGLAVIVAGIGVISWVGVMLA